MASKKTYLLPPSITNTTSYSYWQIADTDNGTSELATLTGVSPPPPQWAARLTSYAPPTAATTLSLTRNQLDNYCDDDKVLKHCAEPLLTGTGYHLDDAGPVFFFQVKNEFLILMLKRTENNFYVVSLTDDDVTFTTSILVAVKNKGCRRKN